MEALVEFLSALPVIGAILLWILGAAAAIAVYIIIFVLKAKYMAHCNAQEIRKVLIELKIGVAPEDKTE